MRHKILFVTQLSKRQKSKLRDSYILQQHFWPYIVAGPYSKSNPSSHDGIWHNPLLRRWCSCISCSYGVSPSSSGQTRSTYATWTTYNSHTWKCSPDSSNWSVQTVSLGSATNTHLKKMATDRSLLHIDSENGQRSMVQSIVSKQDLAILWFYATVEQFINFWLRKGLSIPTDQTPMLADC